MLTSLTFRQYQVESDKTAAYRDEVKKLMQKLSSRDGDLEALGVVTRLLNVCYSSLGLGEVGEIQGKVKKIIRDSGGIVSEETRKAISKELGDLLWYAAAVASDFGLDLEEIAIENIEKLRSRKERGVIKGSGDNR